MKAHLSQLLVRLALALALFAARHCIVRLFDRTRWTWGWNINGQLGDGTTTDRNAPVQVLWLLDRLFLPLIAR